MRNLLLFLVAAFFLSACQSKQPEIGLQLYSLRHEFKKDVPGTLAKIKSFGIHEIEGGDLYGYSQEEYKKLLAENELDMVSVGIEFDELSNPQPAIDKAKAFGAKFIVCFWISHPGDTFTIEETKKAVAAFNDAGKKIHESGFSFCYHPHGFEFRPYEDGTLFDYLVKNTDPKYVNYEMDVFWVKQPGKDPVALLQKYPDRFVLMHLKDRAVGTPDSQDGAADDNANVVLGAGDVGIAAVMEQAKKNGVKHYFIEDESDHAVEQIPQSLEYLKKL